MLTQENLFDTSNPTAPNYMWPLSIWFHNVNKSRGNWPWRWFRLSCLSEKLTKTRSKKLFTHRFALLTTALSVGDLDLNATARVASLLQIFGQNSQSWQYRLLTRRRHCALKRVFQFIKLNYHNFAPRYKFQLKHSFEFLSSLLIDVIFTAKMQCGILRNWGLGTKSNSTHIEI